LSFYYHNSGTPQTSIVKKLILAFNNLPVLQKWTFVLSIAALLSSFAFPAFYTDSANGPDGWSSGLLLFFLGWMFPLGGAIVPFLFWLANPIYVASLLLLFMKKKIGLYLSVLPSLIAIGFSRMETIMTSERPEYSKITSLELGYKLWLTSFLILAVGTWLSVGMTQKK